MPWTIRKTNGRYCVIDQDDTQVACHETADGARMHQRALYAHEPDMGEKAKYDAKAGETIAGRLVRGGDGKFAASGSAAPSKKKPGRTSIGARRAQKAVPKVSAGRRGGKGKKGAKKGGRGATAAQRAAERARLAAQRKAEQAAKRDQANQERLKREGVRLADRAKRDATRKQTAAQRLAERERQRAERAAAKKDKPAAGGKGGGGKSAKPDKAAQAAANRATIAQKLKVDLDSLAMLADGGEIDTEMLESFVTAGLARVTTAGPVVTPAGQMVIRAAERGDERRARELLIRAQEMKERAALRGRLRTKGQDASDRAMFAKMGQAGTLRARGPDGKRDGERLPKTLSKEDRARQKRDQMEKSTKIPRNPSNDDIKRAFRNAGLSSFDTVSNDRQALSIRMQVERDKSTTWAQVNRALELAKNAPARERQRVFLDNAYTPKAGTKAIAPGIMVVKQTNGRWRWILRTTSAWRDKDGQWLTLKGLQQAVDYNNVTGNHGPLRWWHLGTTNEQRAAAGLPPQPTIDIGDCDTSMMIGPFLYESGTFRDERLGPIIAAQTDLGVSPGFRHWDGVKAWMPGHQFENFILRERSLLPDPIASNYFTAVMAHGGYHDPA